MISEGMTAKRNKTIAYIRVSSQRQVDEGVSVASQKRIITQLAGRDSIMGKTQGSSVEEKTALRRI